MGEARRPALRRSREDRVIGGVAGGIATYFDVDPVLVRLAFVLLVLAGGSGVIVYLLAWLMIPEEEGGGTRVRRPAVDGETARLFLGGGLIVLGGVVLAQQFIPYFGRIFWPLALIAGGAILILGARR